VSAQLPPSNTQHRSINHGFYSSPSCVACRYNGYVAGLATQRLQSSPHDTATLNSLDMASMTITNNNGLNAEPWCITTFTSKPLLLPQTVLTTTFAEINLIDLKIDFKSFNRLHNCLIVYFYAALRHQFITIFTSFDYFLLSGNIFLL